MVIRRGVLFRDLDWKFRSYQASIALVVFGPWVLIPSMMYLAWETNLIRVFDIVMFLVLHHFIGAGVTVGLHRYFTHRSSHSCLDGIGGKSN